MGPIKWLDGVLKNGSWTCSKCLRKRLKSVAHVAYTTSPRKSPSRTIFAQTASQFGRNSYETAVLRDIASKRSRPSSVLSHALISKDSILEITLVSSSVRFGAVFAILAFGTVWAFSDDAKHSYVAVIRALRVFYALVQCLRELIFPFLTGHL